MGVDDHRVLKDGRLIPGQAQRERYTEEPAGAQGLQIAGATYKCALAQGVPE